MSRISKVLESNVNALIERAEDPSKILEQAIDDMKKGREEARRALIEAKTELRLSEKRRDKAHAESSALEHRAMQAIEAGDEPLARRFLEQKIASEERGVAEVSACDEHEAQIGQLEIAERELERRLSQMPAKRAALLARQATAQARGAKTGATSKAQDAVATALDAFDRMEEKIIRTEVDAEVRRELDPGYIDTSSLDAHKADQALAALKAKMTAQLPSGETPDETPAEPDPAAAPAEPDPVGDSLADLKARLGKS